MATGIARVRRDTGRSRKGMRSPRRRACPGCASSCGGCAAGYPALGAVNARFGSAPREVRQRTTRGSAADHASLRTVNRTLCSGMRDAPHRPTPGSAATVPAFGGVVGRFGTSPHCPMHRQRGARRRQSLRSAPAAIGLSTRGHSSAPPRHCVWHGPMSCPHPITSRDAGFSLKIWRRAGMSTFCVRRPFNTGACVTHGFWRPLRVRSRARSRFLGRFLIGLLQSTLLCENRGMPGYSATADVPPTAELLLA